MREFHTDHMPKELASNTRTKADYNTTIIGGDDAMGELARIREATTGRIGVGGATLATAMLEAGILDEVMLYEHRRSSAAGARCSTGSTRCSSSTCSRRAPTAMVSC